MRERLRVPSLRRAEARLWTGPAAHLLGGALDVLEALGKVGLAQLRERRRS
jgi:hypothetical protein